MEKVMSHSDFLAKDAGSERSFLLLYKGGSEQSECALVNISKMQNINSGLKMFRADVTSVRDIHEVYGVETVPALLIFSRGQLSGIIKGCHESSYYRALADKSFPVVNSGTGEKPAKSVIVYSTPSCSWCNTLKAWLKKNNIRFTDIDISADHKAAEALVRRTGQQGVPQTDINGQIVVGFDQPRLKQLLEIQ